MPYISILKPWNFKVSSAVTQREILCLGKQDKLSKFHDNGLSVNSWKLSLRNLRKNYPNGYSHPDKNFISFN